VELPSADELEGLSEIVLGLAEEDFDSMTWEEILAAYGDFCSHPVVMFARVACDVVAGTPDEGDG